MLWHQILGHLSIGTIKRLVNEGILSVLDFINFETCKNCIKGKQTNKLKKDAKKSSHILEIMHTNIFRKLTSISKLLPFRYFFQFSKELFHLYYKFKLVGNGTLSNGLFHIICLTITIIM